MRNASTSSRLISSRRGDAPCPARKRQVPQVDLVVLRHQDRALDHMIQFANISGPDMLMQSL